MKILLSIAAAAAFFLASCKKIDERAEQLPENPAVMSNEVIDNFILAKLQETGKFEWASVPADMLWSALQQKDKLMSIGYKPAAHTWDDAAIAGVNIGTPDWIAAREALIQLVLASEQKVDKAITREKLQLLQDDQLPFINLLAQNPETIKLLRASSLVRYAEPMGYEPQPAIRPDSDSGCGSNTAEASLTEGEDYLNITPGTKQSWNYTYHNIPGAWSRSTGAGIKIFVIDTGCEFDQENLGSNFNQGLSSGRSIEKIVTLPRATFFGIPTGSAETPDDGCGHGTSMAGAAAAPRGIDGAACGVAYNSNLVTCRAGQDVLIDASREVTGVTNAYKNAANRADVRIISMSMGRTTGSSQITDAINLASANGKLMFCAAGTSFGWSAGWYGVIFPAWLSNVNAVTGVRDNNYNQNCSACHKGAETDFTIVMEKAINERHPLTLAMGGDAPSTVGGSSVATATAAGIAALVWSRFPTYTRTQILNKLVMTSSNYPTKNSSYGWGNLNAGAATE